MGSWRLALYPPGNTSATGSFQIAVSIYAPSYLTAFMCMAWRLILNRLSSINVWIGGRGVRPLFLWLELKFPPIPNPTTKAKCKDLTGGNVKKYFNNTLLFPATLENTYTIGLGGRSIDPAIYPVVSLHTPQPVLRKTYSTLNLSWSCEGKGCVEISIKS